MKYLFRKWLKNKAVEKHYSNAGARFGGDVSYIYMGECLGFRNHLKKWARWEKEYSGRGFRTVSIDDFIRAGGYGENISSLLGIKRAENENPVLHAELYRKTYLGDIGALVDLEKMQADGKQQFFSGTYNLPSTKILVEKQE